jgi:hypothetical protein
MAIVQILKLTHIVISGTSNVLATQDLILNAHTSVRRKRNEGSSPTIDKQHRRREMFVMNPVDSDRVSLTCS